MISNWGSLFQDSNAIAIINGIDDDSSKTKTQAFQTWFLKIEYIDSIMVITQQKIYLVCVPEKVKFLDFLQQDFHKQNHKLELIAKEKGNSQAAIQDLISKLKADGIRKIGLVEKEEQHGETAENFYKAIKNDSHFSRADAT